MRHLQGDRRIEKSSTERKSSIMVRTMICELNKNKAKRNVNDASKSKPLCISFD